MCARKFLKRRIEPVQHFFAFFLLDQHTFRSILVAFAADTLGIEYFTVIGKETVGDLVGRAVGEFSQIVQDIEMQHDIVVRETFGLPYPIQRVCVEKVAVNGQIDILALCRSAAGVLLPDIAGQPAFQPAAFVIVGAAAPAAEFVAGLKTVHEEVADIFSAFGKGFDEFMEF